MIKKSIKLLLISLIVVVNMMNPFALEMGDLPQGETYSVVGITDNEAITLKTFKTYASARTSFERAIGEYDNVLVVRNGQVIQAQYAVVKVHGSSACDQNVEFKNDLDNSSNYTNGCYGADAAYLDTSADGSQIKFKISGTVGWANRSDLTIVPIEFLPTRLSTYVVKEGNLYHQIKQSFESDFYSAMIDLGPAPEYLENDVEYYSYDGHYFYNPNQLKEMLDDYKDGRFNQSVNFETPYYNYYQYVSHRTLTNVTQEEVQLYFEDTLQISGPIDSYLDLDKDSANDTLTQSQFYNQQGSFYQYQYQYGANALMMLALSMNETAFGRSSLSFTRNNLFGHAAYDSDVERNASRYFSVHSSIYSHAKYYISGSYSNPLRFQFHGGFFGNKASGMNVSYASDPYWGEKAAQYYLKIDEIFGFKDYNSVTLGIKTSTDNVEVYYQPNGDSKVLYTTGVLPDFAFVIIDEIVNENGRWYKVQSEATYDEQGTVDISHYYDYENYVGYVRQGDIQVVLNEELIKESELVTVSFDANGGSFQDGSSQIQYKIEKGRVAAIEVPTKENFLFTGWDKPLNKLDSDESYSAQYKAVDRIELLSIPKTGYEYNDRIDLANGIIRVYFEDQSTKDVEMTSSMVSGYDFKVDGDQEVTVAYAGKSITYPITVSQELDDIRQQLQKEIISIIEELGNLDRLDDEQAERVLDLKVRMDEAMIPYLTQAQLRILDKLIYMAIDHRIYYVIYENKLEASVSGLSLAIPLGDSLDKWLNDTYKVVVRSTVKRNSMNQVKDVARGSGYQVHDGLTLTLEKNLQAIELENPILISIKKPKDSTVNQLFTVFMVRDGEVVKCYTKQTNDYIQFMASSTGEFVVVSRNTTNDYLIENVVENVRVDNRDIDLPLIGSILLVIVLVVVGFLMVSDYQWRHFKKKKKDKKRLQEELEEEGEIDGTTSKSNCS